MNQPAISGDLNLLLKVSPWCVYIPTAITEALSLPSTTSGGKANVTFLDRLIPAGKSSSSREVENDCSRPSACRMNGHAKDEGKQKW